MWFILNVISIHVAGEPGLELLNPTQHKASIAITEKKELKSQRASEMFISSLEETCLKMFWLLGDFKTTV